MLIVIHSLIPIFILIFTGLLLKRSCFLSDEYWPAADRLTYYLFTPALLIHSLGNKKGDEIPWLDMLLTIQGTVLLSALLLCLWCFFNRSAGFALLTSVFQGGVRFNTFVALAVAEALFGVRGLALAAMGAGFMIPLINLLCISAFSLRTTKVRIDAGSYFRNLATNPLIIGCLIGGTLNISGLGLPAGLDGAFALTGKAALPIGLMSVGAAYQMTNMAQRWWPVLTSCIVQLLCKPLTAWGLAHFFALNGIALPVTVLLFAVPTAPSAYILSRQLGGDHVTMASIITAQSMLSLFSLPITFILLGQ